MCIVLNFISCYWIIIGLNDDSDASSVCSISTCPGDLDYRKNSPYRPMMPTFEDSDQGVVSDQPSSRQSIKAAEKSSNEQSCRIRRRPPGIPGPFRLCRYHDRPSLCWQGKLCPWAHSEAEREAWEEDRKKGKLSSGVLPVRKRDGGFLFFFLYFLFDKFEGKVTEFSILFGIL